MFNYNSPIVNNMGAQYSNVPPNPMGNIVNIGNSGYLNGNYQGRFYDPFQARRQQEAQLAQQREYERQQTDMFKKLSKGVNNALGQEISDERLNELYNPQYAQPIQQDPDELAYHHLMNMNERTQGFNPRLAQVVNNCNMYYEQMEQKFPKDMSLAEFYEESYQIKMEIMQEKQKEQNKDLTKLYDRNGYAELRKIHAHSSKMYNTIFGNQQPTQSNSIDDMTVSVGAGLLTEQEKQKQIRKQQYLAEILRNNSMG